MKVKGFKRSLKGRFKGLQKDFIIAFKWRLKGFKRAHGGEVGGENIFLLNWRGI
jgi:hypothetical protein